MLRCTGKVVRFESKPWTMEGRSGTTHTCRVMVGDADFADVKVPEGVQHPRKGDHVDFGVVPGISGGKVSVTVRGNWSDLVSEDQADLTVVEDAPTRRPRAAAVV